MKFTKMQGIGNDYVYVNCLKEKLDNRSQVARWISDRHFGVGSDGLILINPSDRADFEMEMYNSDGSRAEMCGNGIRCVGKYVFDYGLTDKTNITIDTLAGVKHLTLTVCQGKVSKVRVNMGNPILSARQIPVCLEEKQVVDYPLMVDDTVYHITCVSMGNPHAVIFMEEIDDLKIEELGPQFETHLLFPSKTNTEFVHVIDRNTVAMRVWERGAGETLACGTGACATAVACILNGLTEDKITVKLLGGDLEVEWNKTDGNVYMTGTATTVFDGEISLENLK